MFNPPSDFLLLIRLAAGSLDTPTSPRHSRSG